MLLVERSRFGLNELLDLPSEHLQIIWQLSIKSGQEHTGVVAGWPFWRTRTTEDVLDACVGCSHRRSSAVSHLPAAGREVFGLRCERQEFGSLSGREVKLDGAWRDVWWTIAPDLE